jgi:hypothetical protein
MNRRFHWGWLLAGAVQAHAASLPSPTIIESGPQASVGSSWVRALDDDSTNDVSSAALDYSFEVVGPAGVTVPMRLDYFLQATGQAIGTLTTNSPDFSSAAVSASARLILQNTGLVKVFSDEAAFNANSIRVTKNINAGAPEYTLFSMPTNLAWHVGLFAVANAGGYNSSGQKLANYHGSAFAYADPLITIDSAFATANPGYSLVFSPGIDNVLPVPEPAPVVLLLAGGVVVVLQAQRKGAWRSRRFAS